MRKTFAALALTAAPLAVLVSPSAANASAGWLPDHVIVQPPLPDGVATDGEMADALAALDAKPGTVVKVTWRDCGQDDQCAYLPDGTQIDAETPELAPEGHEAETGSSTYPIYTQAMTFDVPEDAAFVDHSATDRNPNEKGAKDAQPALTPGDVVWASDQTTVVHDPMGIDPDETWVRVGSGPTDAWVRQSWLTPVSGSDDFDKTGGGGVFDPVPDDPSSTSDAAGDNSSADPTPSDASSASPAPPNGSIGATKSASAKPGGSSVKVFGGSSLLFVALLGVGLVLQRRAKKTVEDATGDETTPEV